MRPLRTNHYLGLAAGAQAEAQTARRPARCLAMRRRFLATVPVGTAVETMAASNLCAPTGPMARPHHEERKEHALDTVA
jgi:hypothetical protein